MSIHPGARHADLGQNFELTVDCPASLCRDDLGDLRGRFLRAHERVYGYAAPDEPIQIVATRLTALGEPEPVKAPSLLPAAGPDPGQAQVAERLVYFEEAGQFIATPIYRRKLLRAGHRLDGPAVVEQMDSTTVILPGQAGVVDTLANLLIRTRTA